MNDDSEIIDAAESQPERKNGHLRDARGKFLRGTGGGPGNPNAAAVGKHRAALFASAKADDAPRALATLRDIMTNEQNHNRDRIAAACALLDRLCGKPAAEALDPEERRKVVKMFLCQVNVNAEASK